MTSRTAAARYARALLDVAARESVDLESVAAELEAFVTLLAQQPELSRVMYNPAVPSPRKRGAMQQLAALSKFSPIVSKLLVLLAERDRVALLRDIVAAYRQLLADRQNVVRAEVTSAEPLSVDRVAAIERQLAAVTGKRVAMTTKVDRGIIGGVVARVGSTVYDASIATQLKKMRDRLTT